VTKQMKEPPGTPSSRKKTKPQMNLVVRAEIKQAEIDSIFDVFNDHLEDDVTRDDLLASLGWPNTARNRLRLLNRVRDIRWVAHNQGCALTDYDVGTKSWKLTKSDTARIVRGMDRRLRTASTLLEVVVAHGEWANRTAKDMWTKKYAAMAEEVAGSARRQIGIVTSLWHLRDLDEG
jgi:hypothetical protein